MGDRNPRVLIVEHDAETAELLDKSLDGNGYDAEWMLEPEDIVGETRSRHPDLVIYDVTREQRDPFRSLDLLRSDPDTSRIPVLVTSHFRPEAEAALASYNVRDILYEPFDLNDLLSKVRTALGRPPLQARLPYGVATHSLILALGYHILAEHSREAVFRWVQRLQSQPPWRGRTDLGTAALIDHVPLYVEALCCALACGEMMNTYECMPDLVPRLREHAQERRSHGIALEFVIREHTILRDEIWRVFQRYLPRQLPTEDMFKLEATVNRTLDQFLEVAAGAYTVSARRPTAAASPTMGSVKEPAMRAAGRQ